MSLNLGSDKMAITVYIVRHGQTLLNRYKKMQGWVDSPLTEKGIQDGKRAGKILENIKFDKAYSSDTMRAIRTCEYILNENKVSGDLKEPQAMMEFREQKYGYFEGSDSPQTWMLIGATHGAGSFKELVNKYPLDEIKDFMHETDPFHESEDSKTYWKRINSGFDYLRKNHKDGETVLLVCHGSTIASLADKYGDNINVGENYPQNGSITKLKVTENDIEIEEYNKID